MASFNVHLAMAGLVSGAAAATVIDLGWATLWEVALYVGLGTVAGLLPDIDAEGSRPFTISAFLLALLIALMTMLSLERAFAFSIWWLAGSGVAIFLVVRYGAFRVFSQWMVHRGALHSIPAALLGGLVTVGASSQGFGLNPFQSWLSGSFVSLGYVVHLVLDELSSVDLFGIRMKRSFGSALTLFARSSPGASLLLYMALILAFYSTPTIQPFIQALRSLPGSGLEVLSRVV